MINNKQKILSGKGPLALYKFPFCLICFSKHSLKKESNATGTAFQKYV
ncbi:hypothetical protein [Enterococcus innesii]|nr:hypothetical protein [Enterococcus innesii]